MSTKKSKAKKKNYNVVISAFATVLVIGAESPEQALQYANDQIHSGDFQIDESSIKEEVAPNEIENARRHADCVSEDEG